MTSTIRCTLAILLLSSASAAAQDSLDPVRNLYASAEYEEALTAIGRLKSNADLGGVVEIDRYRALCLIALGRSAEADQAIETTVTLDPLYQPAAADASPRVRAAFAAVRHRVLPTVVRSLYASAKAAYDRKAFAEAADGLDKTVRVIDNLEGSNPELGDLRMLASGFLDLSKAAIAKPSVPPPPAPTPAPVSLKRRWPSRQRRRCRSPTSSRNVRICLGYRSLSPRPRDSTAARSKWRSTRPATSSAHGSSNRFTCSMIHCCW